MTTGTRVRVYPHGSPAEAAAAVVELISGNGCSVAVSFDDKPPFVVAPLVVAPLDGILFASGGKIAMLAVREILDGKPWGPWIELMNGGHYEIEELAEG